MLLSFIIMMICFGLSFEGLSSPVRTCGGIRVVNPFLCRFDVWAAHFKNVFADIKIGIGCTIEVYTDGSFQPSKSDKKAGWGFVIVDGSNIIHKDSGMVPTDSRQIAGEIAAVINALDWLKTKNVSEVEIIVDYTGLKYWAEGSWKTEKPVAKAYLDSLDMFEFKISFTLVKSHSGNLYNDMADQLAADAIKIEPLSVSANKEVTQTVDNNIKSKHLKQEVLMDMNPRAAIMKRLERIDPDLIVSSIHNKFVEGYTDLIDMDNDITMLENSGLDVIVTHVNARRNDPPRLMVLNSSFFKTFHIDPESGYGKMKKRITRLLDPGADIREFKTIASEILDNGIIHIVKGESSRLKIGIFPVYGDDLLPVDGVILVSRSFGIEFGIPLWGVFGITTLTPEGEGKGHGLVVPLDLPYGVDVLVLDPKTELKLRGKDTMFMGISGRSRDGIATIMKPKLNIELDIQTILNFLTSNIETVIEKGTEKLISLARMIPNESDPETLDKFIKQVAVHNAELAAMVKHRHDANVPMFACELSATQKVFREHHIYSVVGSQNNGPGIPVKGITVYPKVDPYYIIHGLDIISDLELRWKTPIMISPHVNESTEAIVVRQPNSKGEFFRCMLMPANLFPNWNDLTSDSAAVFMSSKSIVKMMNILGDGDQDDRVLVITDPDILSAWDESMPKLDIIDHSGSKILSGTNITNGSIEYLKIRNDMGWSIGILVNAVMIARTILADNILITKNKNELPLIKRVSMIPSSQALDFQKAGIIGSEALRIKKLLDDFYDRIHFWPAFFAPGCIRGTSNEIKFIRELFTRHARARIRYRKDEKSMPTEYAIMDNFSNNIFRLYKFANAIINKMNMLTWKVAEQVKPDIIELMTKAKFVIPISPAVAEPKELAYGSVIDGSVLRKGNNFWCRPKDNYDGIQAMSMVIKFWRGLIMNIERTSNSAIMESNIARGVASVVRSSRVRNAKSRVRFLHKLVDSCKIDPTRPNTQRILSKLVLPVVDAMRTRFCELDHNIPKSIPDNQVLSYMGVEALAITYRVWNPRGCWIKPGSSWSQGRPYLSILDLNPKECAAIYMNNIIYPFSDTLVGNIIRAIIAVKITGSAAKALKMANDLSDGGRLRWREMFAEYAGDLFIDNKESEDEDYYDD